MLSCLKLVLRENPLGSPFAPKKKPFLTFLSSLVNLAGQQDTNNMNAQLQHEQMEQDRITNETNFQINREQFANNMNWLREQYYKNREFALQDRDYNSISNQVRRAQAAGLNPAAVVGNGSSSYQLPAVGSVGGASASSPSGIGAGRSAPYQWTPFSFGNDSDVYNAINAFNQSELMKAQVKETTAKAHSIDLENDLFNKTMDYRIKEIRENANKTGIEGDLARKQLDFIGATLDYDIKLRYGQTVEQEQTLKNMQEQFRQLQLQNDILNITKAYSDDLNRAQIAQIWHTVNQIDANIGLINSNKMLTEEQRKTQIQETVGKRLDNGLKGIEKNIRSKISDYLIQSAKNDANEGMARAFNAWKYNPNGSQRSPSEIFQMDNLEDFMKKRFKRVGYVPKF